MTLSVCVCTYRRPELLKSLLLGFIEQRGTERFEVVVVDNDARRSAANVVANMGTAFAARGLVLKYEVEGVQNIALARNRAVGTASGTFVAFIDDDEVPDPLWLTQLYTTTVRLGADGVLGPVIPRFGEEFSPWLRRSGLFNRPRHKTGAVVPPGEFRTGNLMLRREALRLRTGPFDAAFGRSGGEDTDFLQWLQHQGMTLLWCDEAVVRETQDPSRASWRWHVRRSYRGGCGFAEQKWRGSKRIYAAPAILASVVLGTTKAIVVSFGSTRNPRAALLTLARGFAVQAGKVGHLLGLPLQEYRDAASP